MRTLAGWIERHAAFTPDKPALLAAAAGTVLSYRALAARIGGLGAWLERERGLNAGAGAPDRSSGRPPRAAGRPP